jgi:hypothetical protein
MGEQPSVVEPRLPVVRWWWWQAAARWRAPPVIVCGWEEVNDARHTMEHLNDVIGGHYPHRRRKIGGDGGGGTIYRRRGKPGVLAARGGSAGKVCTGSMRGVGTHRMGVLAGAGRQ